MPPESEQILVTPLTAVDVATGLSPLVGLAAVVCLFVVWSSEAPDPVLLAHLSRFAEWLTMAAAALVTGHNVLVEINVGPPHDWGMFLWHAVVAPPLLCAGAAVLSTALFAVGLHAALRRRVAAGRPLYDRDAVRAIRTAVRRQRWVHVWLARRHGGTVEDLLSSAMPKL